MTAIPFSLICLGFYVNYSNTVHKEVASSYEKIAVKSTASLNDIIRETENIFLIFNTDTNVTQYLMSEEYVKNVMLFNTVYQNIDRLFRYVDSSSNYIESIHIYNIKSGYVLSSKNSNRIGAFYDADTFEPFTQEGRSAYVVPTGYHPNTNTFSTLTFGYTFILNNTPVGVLAVNVDYGKLKNLINTETNDEITVADDAGRVIFSSSGNAGFAEDENAARESEKTAYGRNLFFHRDVLVNGLVFTMRSQIISGGAAPRGIFAMLTLLISLSLVVPLLISFYASWQFYNSIITIVADIQTANGSTDDGADEISFISKNILGILKSRQAVENELMDKVAKLKAAQSATLQLQINPHFLFNTLNLASVIVMETVQKENDAEKVLKLLSSFLHTALDTKNIITNVESELENIKKYLEIEYLKHSNNFEVIWEVDDGALEKKTIKLILQPIVENAFIHGIRMSEESRGILKIRVSLCGGALVFSVRNNGAGISPGDLREIRNRLQFDDLPQNEQIGLYNVNRRIRLLYGEKFGCRIDSDGEWTTITITQPIV
jgi:two-component system sensor histidine kinase YesM